MDAKTFMKWLVKNKACAKGRRWAEGKSLKQAFAQLNSSEDMDWLLSKMLPDDDYFDVIGIAAIEEMTVYDTIFSENKGDESDEVLDRALDESDKAFCDSVREQCELVDWSD